MGRGTKWTHRWLTGMGENAQHYWKNVNQNYNEVLPHSGQNVHHQVQRGHGEKKHPPTLGGNVNWYSHNGEQYEVFSKN